MELPEQDRQALIEAARRRGVTGKGGAAFGVMPSSGKRPKEPEFPPGSSVLDVPIGGKERLTDTVLRRRPEPEASMTALPAPSMAQRHARGLEGYLTPKIGGPRARTVSQSLLGGQESVLPFGIGLQEFVPFSPYVGEEAGAMVREGQETDSGLTTGLGLGLGALQAFPAAKPLARGAKAAGKALGPKAAEMAEGYLLKSGLAPSVIKPKGGNWLTGDVEKQTGRLKRQGVAVMPLNEEEVADYARRGYTEYDQASQTYSKPDAVNNWIDTKLNKYIRNEMGTPEDPVRKLAERDVLHFEPQQVFGDAPSTLMRKRASAGMPTPLFGKSEMARKWESLADRAVDPFPAASYKYGALDENFQASNPWLEKVPDEAMVYKAKGLERNMGFDHLIDELRNATRADSDLPAHLRWKPEDLKKVTMEQAVERVAKINEYRAAKKAEADELLSRNPATFQFKDYQTVPGTQEPNSKGLSWKQIQPPNLEMPQGIKRVQQSATQGGIDVPGVGFIAAKWDAKTGLDWAGAERDAKKLLGKKPLQEALDYEADVMGHCVRGYCNDVLSGNKQIYSLRDKKGEPHVTIETIPGRPWNQRSGIFYEYPELEKPWAEFSKEINTAARAKGVDRDPNYIIGFPDWLAKNQPEVFAKYQTIFQEPPPEIKQIKGKGNAAPKKEYIPFVQDFVRSGNWSSVGDFHNTHLVQIDAGSEMANKLEALGKPVPKYVTHKELDELLKEVRKPGEFPSYAKGGLVEDTDAIAAKLTGMDKDKALTHALRMANAKQEAHMAAGGLAKLLKGAKASTKAHPTVFPPAAPLTEAEMRPIAQRVAGQMTGEFVRPNPKLSVNPAGKAKKTFEREKTLPVEVTQRIEQKPAPYINYEEMKDAYLAGVPGDPTRGGVAKPGSLSEVHEGAEELRRLGDVEFEKTESGPVQLFGGPRYGAYSERDFWGSNLGPARAIQNTVDELGALGPVYGQYIKMSPESTNFALHNLDALLAYLQPEKLSKSKLEILNREIRKGSPKYGKFPGFSGFEDPIDVLLQSQLHSDLRKHIAETLMKPKLTSSLGLRQGSDVLFGISEPSLRNLETGISGYSVGKMEPGKALTPSLHPTYDYDIPGSFLGQSRYPTPYEIAFPTSTAYTRANLKPGAQEFNNLKMIGAREKIDQQYIDQIKMYEELMKEYTGKKKGGLVKKSGLSVLNKAII